MMDGFARRKEHSKEDIRRAAEELFSRFGADKVSVNDIARKAGVSQATIYNNFGSKEELVNDYHNIIVKKIASSFRDILVWKKSWVEKLQGIIQSWLDAADQYNIEIGKLERVGVSNTAKGQATAPRPEAISLEIENSFREFLKEGREQGNLRADISDEAIITYIRFFQQGIANNLAIHDRMRRDAKLSQDLLSLFIYGINGQNI
jgi:AcrR family transcriptional regulator